MTTTSIQTKRIILVGPPNCGKTTLFNKLTGSKYQTANYPGATVEYCKGSISKKWGQAIEFIDTPGTHSLNSLSLDQDVSVQQLLHTDQQPSAIVALIDATQFSRHYALIQELKDIGFNLIVAISMVDLLKKQNKNFDFNTLSKEIDAPVIPINAPKNEGLENLIAAVQSVSSKETHALKPFKPTSDKKEIIKRFDCCNQMEQKVIKNDSDKTKNSTFDLDKIFLHPLLGLILFLTMMTTIFSAIFWWAGPSMDLIDNIFSFFVDTLKEQLPASWWTDLLADGLIAGIGSVAIFLPQIIILFSAMVILEDSGYLARGAMLIDRPLRAIGLTGRAFVPLMSGFACAVPAMMAARTISSRKERLLTIFILPLMTCSARLPVYALLIAFLIPSDRPWLGGLTLTGLYVGAIVAGAIISTIASKFITSNQHSSFVLELPAYRRPQLKVIFSQTFYRTLNYIQKAGPTIIVISLLLWITTHIESPFIEHTKKETNDSSHEYVLVSNSLAASIGQTLEPFTKPMGLDWRGGVAMLSGFAAREVFVSSLALMYRIEDEDEDNLQSKLLSKMHQETFAGTDEKIFTLSTCLGMLFFFTFALQCFPTSVVAKNETKSSKFALVQLIVFTLIAYGGTVALVQGLRAFGVA